MVSGDPERLQQVLGNLLGNAVKFTGPGGSIDVTARPVENGVEVVVRDSGQGIRPEFLPHVFERFRKGDTTTTAEHGGLGLGTVDRPRTDRAARRIRHRLQRRSRARRYVLAISAGVG